MVKVALQISRYPRIFAVAGDTIVAESGLLVIGIGGLIVVFLVTARTRIRRIRIPVGMTARAIVGNRRMRTTQYINLIVDRELCRTPARFRRMAGRTIRTQAQLLVVRIRRLIKIVLVAADTFHRRAGISIGMAVFARDRSMRSRQWEIGFIMVKVGNRGPGRFGVTGRTISAEAGLLVIGIGGGVVVIDVTTGAGIGCIGKAIGMAAGAIVGDGGMSACQGINFIVDGKLCRTPAWLCGVAGCTIGAQAQLLMVGVSRLIEVGLVAAHTGGGRTGVAIGMAFDASDGEVCSGQREVGLVVVKGTVGGSGGMAGQAGAAGIGVAGDALVFGVGVGLVVLVAVDAADDGKIAGVGMAGGTGIPGTLVGARVNGKILRIVIESGGAPAGLRVAGGTVGGKARGGVRRILRLLVIGQVAAYAGIRSVVEVFVVAAGTVVGGGGMGAVEGKEVVVVGHGRRAPARFGGVAGSTVGAQTDLLVVGVGRLHEVVLVTADALGGGARKAVGVAGEALQGGVSSREREIGLAVVKNLFFLSRRMAGQTGGG